MSRLRAVVPLAVLTASSVAAAACANSTPTVTPTEAGRPEACHAGTCIDAAYLYLDEEEYTIRVNLNLVDPSGEVTVGNAPQVRGDFAVELFRASDGLFLYGQLVTEADYICYAGNDIPWAGGRYASTCGFLLPSTQFQVRPRVGDELRVEIIEFDSVNVATIQVEPWGRP
jgi:hypothetical protein